MSRTRETEANIERWRGFAKEYDRVRPAPPALLLDWIARYAANPVDPGSAPHAVSRASSNDSAGRSRLLGCVVDLGAGTGLSTLPWSRRATDVVGIEPSDDMRRVARQRMNDAGAANVRVLDGLATDSGLPSACADIVTCSQCLHWLDPEPTFREVARILRPGGVFAAYDCDWPPATGVPAVEAAYAEFIKHATEMERAVPLPLRARKWDKQKHLERMRVSGRFHFVREIVLHDEVGGDADRFMGLALTQGGPATLRKLGMSDVELGVPVLRQAVGTWLGQGLSRWLLCYRVRIGIL